MIVISYVTSTLEKESADIRLSVVIQKVSFSARTSGKEDSFRFLLLKMVTLLHLV